MVDRSIYILTMDNFAALEKLLIPMGHTRKLSYPTKNGSPPNCAGDLADLRCVAPPEAELLVPLGDDGGSRSYPPITSSMTNLQVQAQTSGRRLRLLPEAELPHFHIQPTTPHQRGKDHDVHPTSAAKSSLETSL
jgi:hypothetical protein